MDTLVVLFVIIAVISNLTKKSKEKAAKEKAKRARAQQAQDVYKRQYWACPTRGKAPCSTPCWEKTGPSLPPRRAPPGILWKAPVLWKGSVSYTHLDVYKRQIQYLVESGESHRI